jgi:hypothetical protein
MVRTRSSCPGTLVRWVGGVRRARLLLASALVASLVAPTTAAGRTLHLVCHDGDPQVLLKGGGAIPSDEATCDSVSDGVCAFTVRVPVGPCGCLTPGCCWPTLRAHVPVKRKKRIRRHRFPLLVLRCLPRGHTGLCEGPSTPTVHLSTNIQPILDRSCAVAGCHSGPTPIEGMDLSAGKTFSSTVEVPSTEIPSVLRVNPGKPDDSYLLQKVEGTPGISGVQDPPGCPGPPINGAQCLSADDITAILQWITECALNN